MAEVDFSCIDSTKPTYGCRRKFRFKDYPGLCARCTHLADLVDPAQLGHDTVCLTSVLSLPSNFDMKNLYQQLMPTCAGCGGIFAHLAPNTQCGICERKSLRHFLHKSMVNTDTLIAAELEGHDTDGSQDIQNLKRRARTDAMAARTLPGNRKSAAQVTVSKAAAVASGVQGGREIQLFLAPVVPKGTMLWNKLGVAIDTFSETTAFDGKDLGYLFTLSTCSNLVLDRGH